MKKSFGAKQALDIIISNLAAWSLAYRFTLFRGYKGSKLPQETEPTHPLLVDSLSFGPPVETVVSVDTQVLVLLLQHLVPG